MDSLVCKYQSDLVPVDTEISSTCKMILDTFGLIRRYSAPNYNHYTDVTSILSIVGSATEGCVVPRMFASRQARSLEADIMVQLATVPKEMASMCLQSIPGKNWFFRVQRNRVESVLTYPVRKKYQLFLDGEMSVQPNFTSEFLSGSIAKEMLQEILFLKDDGDTISKISGKMFGNQGHYHWDQKVEFHGPSTNIMITLRDKTELIASVSGDGVPYIQLDYWPAQASSWMSRVRQWPPPELVDRAVEQGCQLVPKPYKTRHSTCVDHEQWRLTFTKAENLLAQNRTEVQKLVYMIAKSIFYRHLEVQVGDHQFSSYCLKTVMMDTLEQTPKGTWSLANVLPLVQMLFEKLESSLNSGVLPYHFIPSVNILEEYPKELLYEVRKKMGDLHNRGFLSSIPGPEIVEEISQRAKYFVSKIKEGLGHAVVQSVKETITRTLTERNKTKDAKVAPCHQESKYEDADLD